MRNKFNEKQLEKRKLQTIMAIIPVSMLLYSLYWTLFNSNFQTLMEGFIRIQCSPTILMTDFMEVGDLGAAALNAGIIGCICIFMAKRYDLKIGGIFIASFFTALGFAFFGENLYNILPIYFGGYLYTRVQKSSFRDVVVVVMFASGLAPIVSEISYAGFMPQPFGIIIGIIVGIFVGFIIAPFSSHTLRFHDGFNLYNVGFAVGIIGTMLTSVLRSLRVVVRPVDIVHKGFHLSLIVYVYLLCLYFIFCGIYINNEAHKGFKEIFKFNGRLISDFTYLIGYGITFFNMGIMGIFSLSFIILMGGILNGPTLAAILSIMGFSAFGKHIKNTIPIMLGVILAAFLLGQKLSSTEVLISILFSTGLAPIAGAYGSVMGFVAGILHLILVNNIGVVHGGMNLLNNGFSAGVIAAIIVPVADALKREEIKR